MASHALGKRRLADVAPHLLALVRHHVLGAHRVRHELASAVQAPVVLEVEEVVSVHGGDPRRSRLGVAVVHLKLDPEVEACRLRVRRVAEDGSGLEVVGLDGSPAVVGGAGPAVAPAVGLSRVARAEEPSAAVASREAREALVAYLKTVVRDGRLVELCLVALPAEAAGVGECVCAASAEGVRLGCDDHLLGEVVGAAAVALRVSRLGAFRADIGNR